MRTLVTCIFAAALAASAEAQGLGYGVLGAGGTTGIVEAPSISGAVGGAWFVRPQVSLGGEVGMFDRFIVSSANVGVHAPAGLVLAPFVTAGYSHMGVADGEGSFSAINVGVGLDAWRARHAGLRIELRDHIRLDRRSTSHYWAIRAGFFFR